MEASTMISAWHLCHSAIDETMGHSLGHRGDSTVKIFSLSSNFISTKKGGLVDLRDILIWKRELRACEYALFSPSHLCFPSECTNTVVCYRTHLKR